jgi:hypothetical protein
MAKSKQQKKAEAEIRQAEYNELSFEQKITRIKAARGKSRKQLEKLQKQTQKRKN